MLEGSAQVIIGAEIFAIPTVYSKVLGTTMMANGGARVVEGATKVVAASFENDKLFVKNPIQDFSENVTGNKDVYPVFNNVMNIAALYNSLIKPAMGVLRGPKPIEQLPNNRHVVENPVKPDKKPYVKPGSETKINVESFSDESINAIEGGGDDFVGILKGEKVTLPNVKGQTIKYTKVSAENLAELRKAFNTTDRKEFLSYLSNDKDMLQQLKTAGLTDTDILKMKNGYVPTGYQVHHKIPLDGAGTNSFDNLVLIKNDPYHKVITNTQNSVTSGLDVGQTIKIDNWPIPDGIIYPKNK